MSDPFLSVSVCLSFGGFPLVPGKVSLPLTHQIRARTDWLESLCVEGDMVGLSGDMTAFLLGDLSAFLSYTAVTSNPQALGAHMAVLFLSCVVRCLQMAAALLWVSFSLWDVKQPPSGTYPFMAEEKEQLKREHQIDCPISLLRTMCHSLFIGQSKLTWPVTVTYSE